PVARNLCDGVTIEINRVCTDGTPHSASMLYGAITRAAKALGYRRVVMYTLMSEPGTSLRAAGWADGTPIGKGSWQRPTQPKRANRTDVTLWGERRNAANIEKRRWERVLYPRPTTSPAANGEERLGGVSASPQSGLPVTSSLPRGEAAG
ncbi:MAG: XF1762 family protein, partial [Pseudomonadota bacterium]